MSIIDVFTFKKEAKKVFSKENFLHILETTREGIISQAKSNIPGPEKKAALDAVVTSKIDILISSCKNKLVIWLLEQIKTCIPFITQVIYNFLKEKVENL